MAKESMATFALCDIEILQNGKPLLVKATYFLLNQQPMAFTCRKRVGTRNQIDVGHPVAVFISFHDIRRLVATGGVVSTGCRRNHTSMNAFGVESFSFSSPTSLA